MRKQPTLVEHDAAEPAGSSRLCLYLIAWCCACHTQEDTMKLWVRRGLWWGGAAESGGGGGVGTNDQAACGSEA